MGRSDPGSVEAAIGDDCFLCGRPIVAAVDRYTFSPVTKFSMAPELPCHRDCLLVRGPVASARIYHQRVADVVNIPRVNPIQRMFRRLLLGQR